MGHSLTSEVGYLSGYDNSTTWWGQNSQPMTIQPLCGDMQQQGGGGGGGGGGPGDINPFIGD